MTDLDFPWSRDGVFSIPTGVGNIDGRSMIIGREGRYTYLWAQCIPISVLSYNNLSPFHVRLRDHQGGILGHPALSCFGDNLLFEVICCR